MSSFWAVCGENGAICMDDNDQTLIFSRKRDAKEAAKKYAGEKSEIVRVDKVEIR